MQAGQARLAIDCGNASTTAVVAWPDGAWVPLMFDGEPALPSAVLLAGDGNVLTGHQAWQAATADPQRFIPTHGSLPSSGSPSPARTSTPSIWSPRRCAGWPRKRNEPSVARSRMCGWWCRPGGARGAGRGCDTPPIGRACPNPD
ncbi:hypothetical protein [Micromonospora deserti]|uniref:hypothetical protein n=1 Tax=Micromonospora deserti TaxID=2070366 RepID=UPI0018F42304|nr:hypothetical protein [Micromonospora deserti]